MYTQIPPSIVTFQSIWLEVLAREFVYLTPQFQVLAKCAWRGAVVLESASANVLFEWLKTTTKEWEGWGHGPSEYGAGCRRFLFSRRAFHLTSVPSLCTDVMAKLRIIFFLPVATQQMWSFSGRISVILIPQLPSPHRHSFFFRMLNIKLALTLWKFRQNWMAKTLSSFPHFGIRVLLLLTDRAVLLSVSATCREVQDGRACSH